MCGIVGAMGPGHAAANQAHLTIGHRGPDGSHVWVNEAAGVTLGHARLAILDLTTAADQPMVSADGKVALIFNGEIYNFHELRKELQGAGATFNGTGDTEVVLQGYLRWGERIIQKLRGMFAFALWDGRDGSLLLVRDRVGIKPLFWTLDNGTMRFGSELKAVLCQRKDVELRKGAIAEFLTWLYVPAPGTFYEGVFDLPPAHLVRWKPGMPAPVIERYWTVPDTLRRESFDESAERLRFLLEEAVRLHMISDVPVGAFLSGGADSTSIVALMARHSSSPVRTFCMTFQEGAYDERAFAREVAQRYGTVHEEIPVSPKIADLLPKMVSHFDQPFGNPTALLVYELSRLTRQRVTVALAGDGGDEVMLGYPRYKGIAVAQGYARTPIQLRRSLARLADAVIRDSSKGIHTLRRAREFLTTSSLPLPEAYASWVSYLAPDELRELLSPELRARMASDVWGPVSARFRAGPTGDPAAAAARTDLESFLPSNLLTYSDRMSMAHGLELRVPFCDHVLVEFCAGLPSSIRMRRGQSKALMKAAMGDLLPRSVQRRGKLGFNPPMAHWLKNDLKELAGEYLSPKVLRERGHFDVNAVEKLLAEHHRGLRDHSLQIWALMVLEQWQRVTPLRWAA
jgi:asparagine synthase (glutamine-hydrolysing)